MLGQLEIPTLHFFKAKSKSNRNKISNLYFGLTGRRKWGGGRGLGLESDQNQHFRFNEFKENEAVAGEEEQEVEEFLNGRTAGLHFLWPPFKQICETRFDSQVGKMVNVAEETKQNLFSNCLRQTLMQLLFYFSSPNDLIQQFCIQQKFGTDTKLVIKTALKILVAFSRNRQCHNFKFIFDIIALSENANLQK